LTRFEYFTGNLGVTNRTSKPGVLYDARDAEDAEDA
jgi:hypothetical protein